MHNPGTAEESYADSVMINARNIKHVELLEQEPSNTQAANNAGNHGAAASEEGNGVSAREPEEMIREFAMGDQSRMDQKRILIAMEQRIKERQQWLLQKKEELKL